MCILKWHFIKKWIKWRFAITPLTVMLLQIGTITLLTVMLLQMGTNCAFYGSGDGFWKWHFIKKIFGLFSFKAWDAWDVFKHGMHEMLKNCHSVFVRKCRFWYSLINFWIDNFFLFFLKKIEKKIEIFLKKNFLPFFSKHFLKRDDDLHRSGLAKKMQGFYMVSYFLEGKRLISI